MNTPNIDYEFWFNKNIEINKSRENSLYINRHHAVSTQIINSYKNKNLRIAYFTQFENEGDIFKEYERIKSLTYDELENEILTYIKELIEKSFQNEELLLKTFDLIQIWGGRPGGNNIYNRTGKDRININEWLEIYIQGVKLASEGNYESYNKLRSIKHLELPFASKHVNFFSRHLKEKSLIIIDEKIAHCFMIENPKSITEETIKKINELCREKSKKYKYQPWQIEKALFSFHSNYFKGKKLIEEDNISPSDSSEVKNILEWYKKNKSNEVTHKEKKSKYYKINQSFKEYILYKKELYTTKDGQLFIKSSAVNRCKISKNLLDKSNFFKDQGDYFFKFIGNRKSILISS